MMISLVCLYFFGVRVYSGPAEVVLAENVKYLVPCYLTRSFSNPIESIKAPEMDMHGHDHHGWASGSSAAYSDTMKTKASTSIEIRILCWDEHSANGLSLFSVSPKFFGSGPQGLA